MKKILVPTDFSANSKHAIQVAAKIAVKNDAAVELLHTNTALAYAPPLPEYAPADQFDMNDYYTMAAEELYNIKEVSGQSTFTELKLETRVEEGFLYSSIRRVSEEDGVDLIVLGTKGASGATEFFIGSNTEKVIRTASCPVLAVPEKSDATFDIKTIVVPSTLKPDQVKVFELVAAWQKVFPFEVKVLYMNNPAGLDTNEEIDLAVEQIATDAGLTNVSTFVSSTTFNEEISILQFAKENNADLIAMGTHQRQGLSHLLFGSLTEDTANHSDIPVLSIPLK